MTTATSGAGAAAPLVKWLGINSEGQAVSDPFRFIITAPYMGTYTVLDYHTNPVEMCGFKTVAAAKHWANFRFGFPLATIAGETALSRDGTQITDDDGDPDGEAIPPTPTVTVAGVDGVVEKIPQASAPSF